MDIRKRNRNEAGSNFNGGFKKSKPVFPVVESIVEMRKDKQVVASSSKIKFADSDEDESLTEDEEEKVIEEELADVTFGELQRARSDGSETMYRKLNPERKSGRANKNRPRELSSSKPVSRFREVIQVPKKVVRDPRFESLTGQFNVEGFKKRYNFLYENDLPREKEDLKRQMRKSNDPEEINELKNRISWIDKLRSAGVKHTEREILTEHKKKEREAAKQGKQPYYLKKSEIRKRKLVEKYKELKESGKLEKYIEQKRRKNASKDHRYLPYRRPGEQENN